MRKDKQNGFTHLMIVAAVIVIAAIAGAGYLVMKNSDKTSSNKSSAAETSASPAASSKPDDKAAAKAAAKAHFALIYQKKTSEAYQTTCQEFKDLSSYEVFQTTLEKGNYYTIDLSAIEYTTADVRNNQAMISGPVGPLQPDTDMEVSLLKKNGEWCVYGYQAK